jgi:hypothetical protein
MIAPLRLFHLTCRVADDGWQCFSVLEGLRDLLTLNLSNSYCAKIQKRVVHLNALSRYGSVELLLLFVLIVSIS